MTSREFENPRTGSGLPTPADKSVAPIGPLVDPPLQVIWTSRVRTMLYFVVTAILFIGCADLRAIRKFADTAADSAQYTALSSDYPKSIERQKRYQPNNQQQTLDSILKTRQSQQP